MRISPYVPPFIDTGIIQKSIDCDKILVEFLRVNSFIKKKMPDIDLSDWTIKSGGYNHLPLERKIELLQGLEGFEVSVCEDEDTAYDYWRENYNPNPLDCCNLRME